MELKPTQGCVQPCCAVVVSIELKPTLPEACAVLNILLVIDAEGAQLPDICVNCCTSNHVVSGLLDGNSRLSDVL